MPYAPSFDRGDLINALSACPLHAITDPLLQEPFGQMRELLLCTLCESDSHLQPQLLQAFLLHYLRISFYLEARPSTKALETCKEVFARAHLYHVAEPLRTKRYHATMQLLAK